MFVEFTTADNMHCGFSSYVTIEELELLIRSLIHDGFKIKGIFA